MLESNKEKQETKKDMANKVEAWKTINSVLVKKTNDFMKRLSDVLIEKQKNYQQYHAYRGNCRKKFGLALERAESRAGIFGV